MRFLKINKIINEKLLEKISMEKVRYAEREYERRVAEAWLWRLVRGWAQPTAKEFQIALLWLL